MDALSQLNGALSGRYEIEREIGRGGMATVYLARDLRHQRQVALKVLDPELAAAVGADRFLSEIRVTATLQHPNLLPLFDSGEVHAAPPGGLLLFYVMPYVDGESLRARLTRERQLPVDDAIRLTTAVAGKAAPLQLPFDAALPAVSSNSKWIAYESDATQRSEIYVRPISGSAGIVQVSSGGGSEPRWLPDGRLAYRDGRAFRSATIGDGGGVPSVTRRDSFFADPYRRDANFNRQNYDISRDGRFVVLRDASEERDIIVVANWLTEVRAKLRGK
jgi:hypothetical protein